MALEYRRMMPFNSEGWAHFMTPGAPRVAGRPMPRLLRSAPHRRWPLERPVGWVHHRIMTAITAAAVAGTDGCPTPPLAVTPPPPTTGWIQPQWRKQLR